MLADAYIRCRASVGHPTGCYEDVDSPVTFFTGQQADGFHPLQSGCSFDRDRKYRWLRVNEPWSRRVPATP